MAEVREALESMRKRVARPAQRPTNVVDCSGHMIDAADREDARFAPELEGAVRTRMAGEMEAAAVVPGTLAICGGARGADIIFGELALEFGAALRMLLALP